MSIGDNEIYRDQDEQDCYPAPAGAPAGPDESVDMSVLAGLAADPAGEDSELVVELIDLYLEDSSVKLETLRVALANDDGAALRGAAHSLKGSSASIGVRRVAEMCRELERVGGPDPLRRAAEVLTALECEYERVTQTLTAERGKRV